MIWYLCSFVTVAVLFRSMISRHGWQYVLSLPSITALSLYVMIILVPGDTSFIPGTHDSNFQLMMFLAMLGIACGIFLSEALLQVGSTRHRWVLLPKNISITETDWARAGKILVAAALIFVLYTIYASYLGLLDFLTEVLFSPNKLTEQEMIIGREAAFKWFDPRWNQPQSTYGFYVMLVFKMWLTPIAAALAVVYLLRGPNLAIKIISILVILVAAVFAIQNMARAPLAALGLKMLFAFFLLSAPKYLLSINYEPKKLAAPIIAFLFVALAIPAIITQQVTGSGFVDSIVRVFFRLVIDPSIDVYKYYSICSEMTGQTLGFASTRFLGQLVGQEYFYIENIVYVFFYISKVFSGHNNAAFVANMFCDFGFFGVFVAASFVGLFVTSLQLLLIKISLINHLIYLVTYPFALYGCWIFVFGSISSVLVVHGMGVVFILASLVVICHEFKVSKADVRKY